MRDLLNTKLKFLVPLSICNGSLLELLINIKSYSSPLDDPGKKKISLHPPRYQGCYISSCREFYAELNAKCCQSGNLCRKFVNMIL